MKKSYFNLFVIFCFICLLFSCKHNATTHSHGDDVNHNVDIALFKTQEAHFEITVVDCTLSNGDTTKCYQIKTTGLIPKDHQVGPWCIDHIDEATDKGGIWFKDGKVYDVDGTFIKNLPELYHDDYWKLYNEDGTVNKTHTKEDCMELQGAQLVDKFTNTCIECLPEYVDGISKTYTIPITPVKLDTPINLDGGPPPGDGPKGGRPDGPPPAGAKGGKKGGPVARGIAFNGVVFDAPAPLHIILSGYTIPPLDDAGGHINLDSGYHYHAATGVTTNHHQEDTHAAMIGYALDGYGLYATLDKENQEPKDLDDCRGHYDSHRGYHYHVDSAGNNNFINCFSGAVAQ